MLEKEKEKGKRKKRQTTKINIILLGNAVTKHQHPYRYTLVL